MVWRIRQRSARGALAALVAACLAGGARDAAAQQGGDYSPPVHVGEDAVALSFIQGRYTTPVTCKKTDGSTIEVEQAIAMKASPEESGGDSLKITFFGIDIADVAYCYSLLERRVLDRRGTFFVHFRSHNRTDLGVADFRRAAKAGPLTYNAHRGDLSEREIGTEAQSHDSRVLPFDGGDARLIVSTIPPGSDGAKLLTDYESRRGALGKAASRRFTFHFIDKNGAEFMFYGVEDLGHRK